LFQKQTNQAQNDVKQWFE